jgi:hypothetical protein
MSINIKNYTSGVAADRSVSRIEQFLMEMGVQNINKEYKDGKLVSIRFLMLVNGQTVPFKLPAKASAVVSAIKKTYKRLTPAIICGIEEQAERTAWKICCDWVEIQATLIKLEQAEFMEVFLPYVYSLEHEQTFFEQLKEKKFKTLLLN